MKRMGSISAGVPCERNRRRGQGNGQSNLIATASVQDKAVDDEKYEPAISSRRKNAVSITNRMMILLVLERPMVVCDVEAQDVRLRERRRRTRGLAEIGIKQGNNRRDGAKET